MDIKKVTIRAAVITVLLSFLFINSHLFGQTAGPDKVVTCSTTTLEGANDPANNPGVWTSGGPAVVTIPSLSTSPVTGLVPGPNTFTWSIAAIGFTDGVTITYVPADAGVPQTVCGTALLNGSNPSPGTGYWTSSSATVIFDDSASPTATVSNLPFGNTNFTWHVTIEACTSTDVVVITNDLPQNVNAGPDDETCDGTFTFAATDPSVYGGTGQWTVVGGSGNFTDVTLYNTFVNNLTEGPNTFRWTETKGSCSDFDEVTITHNGVIATASDQNICTDNATLDGNLPLGASGVWSIVASTGTITNTAQNNTTVTNLNPNNNTFRWTLTKGTCSNSVDITINYSQLSVNAGPDQNICGDATTLNGNVPGAGETGTWTLQAGSGSITDNTLNNTGVTGLDGLANNIYRWTISKPGCTSVWDDMIIFDDALPADAGADQLDICTNTINLNALSGDPSLYGGQGVWSNVGGATIANPSNYQTTATNIGPGTTVFRWTVTKNSCSVYDEMTVTRNQYFIDAGPDQTICDNYTSLQGSDPGPGGSGTWSVQIGGPADIANVNNPTSAISNIASFPITLRWTVSGANCNGFDEVTIYDQGTTQAEIAGGDSQDAPCASNSFNGLSAVNVPVAGETLTWNELTSFGVTFTNLNGTPTNVNNLPVPGFTQIELTISDGVCTTRDTVVIGTYNFTETVDAGADINAGCSESLFLNATPVSAPYVGTWTPTPATGSDNVYIEDPNDPNSLIRTYNRDGTFNNTFSLTWTVTNGSCSASDDVIVTNNYTAFAAIQAGAPDYVFGDHDIYMCSSAAITLWGHPETGNSSSGGWEIPNADAANFDFTAGAGNVNCIPNTGSNTRHKDYDAGLSISGAVGDWDIVWTQCANGSNNNCRSTDTLHFHIQEDLSNSAITGAPYYNGFGGAKTDFAGPDQTVCGTVATLMTTVDPATDGHANTTGEWSSLDLSIVFSDRYSPTTTVSNLSLGNNIFTWTVTNGCSFVSDDVVVNVSGLSGVDAGADETICDDFTTLDGDDPGPGGSGTWTVMSGGGIITDPTLYNSTVTSLLPGRNVFKWSVISPFCNSEDTVVIYSNKPEHPDAGPDRYFCGSGFMLAQDPTNPGDIAEWSTVSGAANISDINDKNALAEPLLTPTTLRWTIFKTAPNGLQCTDYDDVDVYDYNPTTPDAGFDQTVCGVATMSANPPAVGETGQWTFIQGSATFTDDTYYQTQVSGLDYTQPNILIWTITGPDRPGPEGACSLEDTVQIISNVVYVEAGPDKLDLCSDTHLLDANCPTVGTGAWSVTSGNGVFSGNTCNATVTGLLQGTNILRWTITYNGCDSYDEVTVINNLPTAPNAGLDKTVCGSTTMAGNFPVIGTGTWSVISGGGTFVDPTLNNTVVNGLNYGSNIIVWKIDNNGCALKDTVDIWSDVVGANAGIDETVCTSTYTLNGNNPAPGIGTWTPAGTTATILDPSNRNSGVTGMNPDANIFRWTITNNSCSTWDEVTITNNKPTTADAGPDQVVCQDFTNLDANSSVPVTQGTGLWSSAGSPPIIITDSTDPATLVSNLPSSGVTMFTWTVTKGICVSSDNVQIQYITTSNSAGPDQHICTDQTIMAATNPAPGTGTWSLLAGSALTSFADPTLYNTSVTGLQPGETILLWTVANAASCVNTDTISIFNDGPYPVNAGPDQIVCQSITNLEATDLTIGTGVWTTASGGVTIQDPTLYNSLVSGLNFGITTFTWTATFGSCVVTDNVVIQNDSINVLNGQIDQYSCDGTDIICATTSSYGSTGVWDLVQGLGNIANPNSSCTSVSNLGQGRNTFRWTITSGTSTCVNYNYVNVYNLPVTALAGNDVAICIDDVVLQGNNPNGEFIPPNYPATGYWTQIPPTAPGVIVNPSLFNTQVLGIDFDDNTFRWTVTNGYCTDWDEVVITNNRPSPAYAGPDSILCNSSITLNADDPTATAPGRGYGHWEVLGGGATVVTPTLFKSDVNNLNYLCADYWSPTWWTTNPEVNIFQWVVEYNGCFSRDTVRVINGLPTPADAGPDQIVCANQANMDAIDEGQCAQNHWWEAIPAGGINFYDPVDGSADNTDFNSHVTGLPGVPPIGSTTTFVWHKSNTYGTLTCEVSDTTSIHSLAFEESLNAGNDDAVCNTNYQLSGTPPDSLFNTAPYIYDVTGEWSVIHGYGDIDDITLYDSDVHNLDYDTNIFRWTIINSDLGCIMTDDVYIHNGLPSPALCGPDTSVCEDRALLTATRPIRGQGVWSVLVGTATIENPSCQTFNCNTYANDLPNGANAFLWTVTNIYNGPHGSYDASNPLVCTLTDTLNITNNMVTADAGSNIYICADTVQLSANLNTGESGQWLAGGTSIFNSTGTNSSTLDNDIVHNLTRGRNTFLWTVSNGICNGSDGLTVYDNLPYPNPAAGGDQVICDDSTTLSSNSITRNDTWYDITVTNILQEGYSTQEWTLGAGSGTFANSSLTTTSVTNIGLGTNTYIWNAYYHFTDYTYQPSPGVPFTQTCVLTDNVDVYNNSATASAGSDAPIQCGVEGPGATYFLNADSSQPGIWSGVFSFGSTIVDPTAYNSQVIGMQNGDHVYRWTVSKVYNGKTCTAYDDVIVPVRVPTTAVVSNPSYEICEDFTTLQANVPLWGQGSWAEVPVPSGTIANNTSNITNVTNIGLGTRLFEWTIDLDGCTSKDTITVNNNMILADADDRIDNPATLHVIADNDSAVCQDWYVLSATDPNIYNTGTAPFPTGQWSVLPGTVTFDNATEYNTIVRNLYNIGTKISNLIWTITKGGCTEASTLDITNNEFVIDADVNTNPNVLETCDGDITLAAEQPGGVGNASGYWTIFSGGGTIQNLTLYNTLVTGIPKPNSVFQWNVTRFGCNAVDLVQVDNNQVTSNAGSDFAVCTDTTTLNAGKPATGETGQWFTTFGGGTVTTPTFYQSGVTNMAQGTNRFRWHIIKGNCSADDEVEIINNEPDDFNIEADKEVCGINSSISVNPAPPIGSGLWTINAGGAFTTITNPTAINTAVTDLQPGNNEFVWTVTNALCSKSDNIVLTNNMVIAEAGAPQFVCADSTDLLASNPITNYPYQGTGSWSVITGTGNVIDITAFNSRVNNLTQGLNTFRWTMSLGTCSDSDDANVTNNSVQANASDQTVCTNSATFDGNNPGSSNGLWTTVGSSGTPTITSPTLNISTVTGLGTGVNTFRWSVNNTAGCSDSIDIRIDNGEFTRSAGPDQALCATSSTLGGESAGAGYSGIWTVIAGGATVTIPTVYNSAVTGLTPGDNVFYWTVTDLVRGCTSIDSVKIVNNLPTIATIVTPIPANREVCVNSTAIEGTNPVFGTGVWTVSTSPTGTFFTNSLNYQTTVNNLYPGNNVLTWTISNGTCTSQDQITIINNEVTSVAGADQILCADNTSLNATDPTVIYPNQGTGLWTNTTGNAAVILNPSSTNSGVIGLPIGTTTFTWTVSKGICSQPDDVLITNNSVTAAATDLSECDGDFTLTGNDPSTFGGTGFWEIVGGSGTITAPSTLYNTTITGIPNGNTTTLRWNVDNGTCTDNTTITVTNNNFSVSAGAPQTICGNTTSLNGDDPLTGNGWWTLIAGSGVFDNSTSRTANVSGINPGTNTYRWTITRNGCTNFSDVDITNNSPSTAQITGPVVTETCDGTTTLTANLPAPYYADTQYWSVISGGGTFVNPSTSFTMNVTGMSPGNNIFKWTIERGICPPSEDQITIINNEVTAVAGSDATICANNTFLNATDPSVIYPNQGTGGWTNLSGNGAVIVNSLSANSQVTGLPNGTTTFQWTVSQGTCTAVSQVQITNNSVTAAATDLNECDGDFTLTGNDPSTFGGTGYWEIVGGSGTITAPSTLYNTTITGVPNGNTTTLRWNVDNGTCTDNTTITVTNNNFSVSAGAPQTLCGNTTSLNGDDPLTGNGWWTLIAGSGVFDNSTSRTANVSGINPGTNTYRWTITRNGCTNFSDVDITNNSPSTAQITGPVVTETCDGTTTLTANLPAPYYADTQYWSVISGGGTFVNPSTSFTMNVTGMAPGNNIFKWTIERGICPPSEDQITIINNEVTSVAGVDATICTDNTFLNATDPTVIYPNQGTGGWTNLSGNGAVIVNTLSANSQVTGLPNGTTTFQWTVSQGTCTAVSQVQITNSSVTAAATDLSECDGDFTLTGNDPSTFGGTGYWEIVAGTGTISAPSTLYNTTINGVPNGSTTTLRWNVDNGTCTDNTTITVTNNNFDLSAGPDVSDCIDTYTFNADPPIPGTGFWTLIGGNGIITNSTQYDAVVSGLAQGNNVFRWTVSKGICSNFDDITIENTNPDVAIITAPGPANREICINSVTVQGNTPSFGSGMWSVNSGNGTFANATNFQTLITGIDPGANTFTWTLSNGLCSSSADVTIINNMVASEAGPNQLLCVDTTSLNATPPTAMFPNQGTGAWTYMGAGTALIENSLSETTRVTNLPNGTNTFRWTVSNGTCSIFDDVIINNRSVNATATDAQTCDGNIVLTGNNPAPGESGIWTTFTGTVTFDDNTLYNTGAHNLAEGNNTFVWTIDNGDCSDDANINVSYVNPIASAGAVQNLCNNFTFMGANNPAPGNGVWSVITGSGTFTNASNNGTYVSNIGQGSNVYRWTVTESGCMNFNDVTINNNLPTVSAGPDQSTCVDNVTLSGNAPGGTENGVWTQTGGVPAMITNTTLPNTTITGLSNGASIFTWTISNAFCNAEDQVTITYNEVIANAGADMSSCDGTAALMAVDPSPGTGYWEAIGAGTFSDVSMFNSNVSGLAAGPNTLRWHQSYAGCSDYDDVVVTNNEVFVNAGLDQDLCADNTILVGNNPGTGSGVWTRSGGAGTVTIPSFYNSPVTGLSKGVNIFTWTVTVGSCSNQDEVILNNNEITDVNAGVDRSICGTATTLAALAPHVGESGIWTVAGGTAIFTNSVQYNTGVNNLVQGDNRLVWTLSNGTCSAPDTVVITNLSPTVALVSPDVEICSSVYTLVGNLPGVGETGLWTKEFGATATIVDATSNITTAFNIGAGSNTFRWTISNSICSTYDDIVINNNTITTDAGLDASMCIDTVVLSADNPTPGTGIWSIVNSAGTPVFDNDSQYNTVVRNLASGSNIFKWTATKGGCSAWDVVTISNDTPTSANAGSDQTVCDGTVVLSGNNPSVGNGVWSRLGGAGTIVNPSNYNTLVTGLGSGGNTFRWEITEGMCSDYDDVLVMNELVFASAGMDDEICGTDYPVLNGNQPGAGESGIWTVTGGSGVFAQPTIYNTSVSGLSGGENRLTWTVTRGTCSNSDDVSIYDNTPSQATVSSDQEICLDYTVISGNPPTTGIGEWSVAAGSGIFDNSIGNTTTVRNIGPDINQYRWTITKGTCTSSAVVTVTNNSVFAIVGDSITVCGSTAYLNGNEPQAGQNGIWTVAAGTGILTNSALYNTEVTNLNKGENKFRWTISNGTCSDYADLVVTNNLYNATASVAGPTVICVDSADLLGNIPVPGATGAWSIWAGGGSFDDLTSPTAKVKYLLRGDNTLRWTVTKEGCSNYDDVVITNNMVQALAGADKITCGTDANLVANELYPGENGIWSLVSGSGTILSPSSNETVVTGQGAGVNVFRWSVSGNGCNDQDEVQISENSFFTSAGFNDDVCDTTVTLQAQDPSPGTGIWSFSGPGVVIVTPTSNTTVVNGLQDNSPHTFRWTVFKNGCSAWDEVIITNNLVHAHAGGDQFVCYSQANLSAQNPIAGTGVWTIASGAGTIADQTYYGTSITGLIKGTNTLTWTVTNLTCTDADNVVITNNVVQATAGADQAICFDYTNLSGDQPQNGGYGVWSTAGGSGVVQNPSAFNSAVTNLQRGVNTFRWTVYENGCDNGGDIVQIINNDFDAYAGEDEILPPLTTATNFNATLPLGATGQWSILAGSGNIANLINPTSYVDNMPTGVNQFTWTVTKTNGCADSDDVALTVANFVPFAGNDQIVCTDTAKLNARSETGASSQTWSIVSGGGVFDDIHDPKTIVRGINRGTNVFRWTVSFVGYSAYDDVLISNDSIFVDAGDDETLCFRSHQMNAQLLTGASSIWSVVGLGGGTIVNNSLWNTVVNDLEPGTNYFEWYVDNGNCVSRDTVAITYNLPPIARFETDPTSFCAPDSVTINNTSDYYPGLTEPDEFRWRVENNYIGTTYNVSDDVTHYFTNTGNSDSIFNIILVAIDYETMCTDTFTSTVTAYAVPNVEFRIGGSHERRIPNAVFTFENRSDTDLNPYSWDFGDGTNRYDTAFVGSFDNTYNVAGTYVITLTGTGTGQCAGIYTDTVVVLPPCPFSYDDGSLIAKGCQDLLVEFDDKVYYADSVLWNFYDLDDDNYSDTSTRANSPVFTYTEPGEYHPTIIAWNDACGTQVNPYYTRTDTVIVYPRPVVDFDVSPRLVMLPDQLLTCYNYSDYGSRYLWDFGDDSDLSSNPELADENPQHQYTEPGIYDITLEVWSDQDCYDTKTIKDALIVREEGKIEFPNAFTPNPNGGNGGVYPCGDKYMVDNDNLNDVFYPKQSGVVDYQLEIYNRWGEKIFTSTDLCTGWDGYVNGLLAPQDVYTWRVAVIYKNGHPEKKYGSVTLLR